MHYDRTQGPPKEGEAFYMIPGLSREASWHGAISDICALVLDAVSDLDCRTGREIIDYEALQAASYLLEPLLEFGTVRKDSALEKNGSKRGHVGTVSECIRGGNIMPLIERVWHYPADRAAVMDFVARRYGVYEISHASTVRLHDNSRKIFIQRIYLIALAVVTPSDVRRGLPNPCHSFRKERDMNRGPGQLIPIRWAA